MRARATTTVTIRRGTETNAYNDTVDSTAAVHTGVIAAIAEHSRRVYLPSEQASRVVRSYSARFPPTTDLRKLDRILDERTGAIYLVTEIHQPDSPAITLDVAAELSRTT